MRGVLRSAGKHRPPILFLVCGLFFLCQSPVPALSQDQLSRLRAAGTLRCGLSDLSPGFAEEASGQWAGFDVEICRAVALAVLGKADSIIFVPTNERDAHLELEEGKLDIVARMPAPALSSAIGFGRATAVSYHDGVGLMVRSELDIERLDEVGEASLCAPMEQSVVAAAEAARKQFGWSQNLLVYDRFLEAAGAFFAGRCDVLFAMRSKLASYRANESASRGHRILPDILTFVPMGPLVKRGDSAWSDLVSWTVYAIIEAEERGVTRHTVDEHLNDPKAHPAVLRLLGKEGDLAGSLGMKADWVASVIRELGNYSEIYARTLGAQSPIALTRGPNALWSDGGLLQSRPFQ